MEKLDGQQRLKWAREKAGFESAADLIRAAGIKSPSTYYDYENGHRPITLRNARRYAPFLKVRAEWLFEGEGEPALPSRPPKGSIMVPRISWVSAGQLSSGDAITLRDLEDHVEIAALPKGDWIALTVAGTSMNRVAPDGSTIIVNRADQVLRNDAMYVFQTYDEHDATFKRYREGEPPRLQPYSTDPDHETTTMSKGMTVVGRVKRVIIDL